MFTTGRGIAFTLATAIAILVTAFLSLVDNSTSIVLLVAFAVTFSASYLLTYFTLELLIFREIGNIYSLLEQIQKKEFSDISPKAKKGSLSPLSKINRVINSYALARQKEIEALKQNAAFRREFIADISHELKTPIFATQGYIHTLLDGAIDDKEVRMLFLKRAAKSLDSLDILVQDLLTLNQMESGVVKFNMSEFNLSELLQDVVDELEYKADKREMSIVLQMPDGPGLITKGDQQKIYRVCQNLIVNAMKYNQAGGKVTVSLSPNSTTVTVKIKDNGQGIPPEDLNRIFERFYRVEKSRNKKEGGSGLGLAIVKHILEGHKSKISVSSTVGKGSIFSFSLPLVKVDASGELK